MEVQLPPASESRNRRLALFTAALCALQVLWTFSIYLEAVAILPQLVLMQRTQNIDNLTANYVALLGCAVGRCCVWLPLVCKAAVCGSWRAADSDTSRGMLWRSRSRRCRIAPAVHAIAAGQSYAATPFILTRRCCCPCPTPCSGYRGLCEWIVGQLG